MPTDSGVLSITIAIIGSVFIAVGVMIGRLPAASGLAAYASACAAEGDQLTS
jgi:hypothetical protein